MSWSGRQITEHFNEDELRCRCGCGKMLFLDSAIEHLEALREECGFPFVLSSGYRCPEHNVNVASSGPDGPHTVRQDGNVAVDVLACGSHAYKIMTLAPKHGFTGIGVHQKGPQGKRFIHLDRIEPASMRHPRPRPWSY